MNFTTTGTIKRDRNGNKLIQLKSFKERGFSIQTLQNLPLTHKMSAGETIRSHSNLEVWQEIKDYIKEHGTKHQKQFGGLK